MNDLTVDADSITLYEILVLVSQKDWAHDLLIEKDGRVTLVSGFMIILESCKVHQFELDDIQVSDGQHLNFVQIVAGG